MSRRKQKRNYRLQRMDDLNQQCLRNVGKRNVGREKKKWRHKWGRNRLLAPGGRISIFCFSEPPPSAACLCRGAFWRPTRMVFALLLRVYFQSQLSAGGILLLFTGGKLNVLFPAGPLGGTARCVGHFLSLGPLSTAAAIGLHNRQTWCTV
jgi:hypothetical protein